MTPPHKATSSTCHLQCLVSNDMASMFWRWSGTCRHQCWTPPSFPTAGRSTLRGGAANQIVEEARREQPTRLWSFWKWNMRDKHVRIQLQNTPLTNSRLSCMSSRASLMSCNFSSIMQSTSLASASKFWRYWWRSALHGRINCMPVRFHEDTAKHFPQTHFVGDPKKNTQILCFFIKTAHASFFL